MYGTTPRVILNGSGNSLTRETWLTAGEGSFGANFVTGTLVAGMNICATALQTNNNSNNHSSAKSNKTNHSKSAVVPKVWNNVGRNCGGPFCVEID